MSGLPNSPSTFSHLSSFMHAGDETAPSSGTRSSKGLTAMLLAALVSAVVVVADSVVDTYADG